MCVKIAKLPEPESYALVAGIAAHNVAEQYLLGKIEEPPQVLSKFTKEFRKLRELEAIPEEPWSFNSNWEFIPNGWQHPETWLRMKLDARVDNYIVDFKTGRHYDEHRHQARLYANAHMLKSNATEVEIEFWYLKTGEVKTFEFNNKNLEDDKAHWQERVDIMLNDVEFKPTINQWCKYCTFIDICPAHR
jgi:CRISPR/Cas system-associated exonuclease Cas4 (RecB family)